MWENVARGEHFVRGEPAGWLPAVYVHILNTSSQPVYDVELIWYSEREDGPLHGSMHMEAPLMPGEEQKGPAWSYPLPHTENARGSGVVFRDRAGLWWEIRSGGRLEEVAASRSGLLANGASARGTAPRPAPGAQFRLGPQQVCASRRACACRRAPCPPAGFAGWLVSVAGRQELRLRRPFLGAGSGGQRSGRELWFLPWCPGCGAPQGDSDDERPRGLDRCGQALSQAQVAAAVGLDD